MERMMKNLKISVFKPRQETKPDTVITIPLSALHLAIQLVPKKIKSILEKDGIELTQCTEFTKEKDLKGTLIEIENANERVVIALE